MKELDYMSPKIAFIQKSAYEKVSVHYLAGALRTAGYECQVFIAELENDFYGAIKDFCPNYIAYSLFIGEESFAVSAFRKLKENIPDATYVVGGPFTAIFTLIYRLPEIDYLFRGDGELTLVEFIRRREKGEDVSDLPGISYIDDTGGDHVNNDLRLIDVKKAPMPDRDIYYKKYEVLKNRPTKIFIGSRGCPYRCSYCYNAELSKIFSTPYWRVRPVKDVIEEVIYVNESYGLEWAHFQDGTLNANLPWLKEFLAAYKAAGLPPFLCNCRVENIDEEIIMLMKEAGCERITFGIQSGNPGIRNNVAGRPMDNSKIVNACKLCKDNGIRVGVDIIFGWPGETMEEAMDTIRCCREIDVDSYHSNILIFYPGLQVTRLAVDKGFIAKEPSLEEVDTHHSNMSLLLTENKRIMINLDKWFNYLIRYPWLEPLILPLLRFPPNRFYYILKNLHLLRRGLFFDTDRSKIGMIKDYLVLSWRAVR